MRLSCQDVAHEFRDATTTTRALAGVSLTIEAGEFALIYGPSGSGKSTLLAVLAGLLRPTRGTAHLGDIELTALDEEGRARVRRQHIGFVFQSFHLFPALTASANVECVLEMRGLPRARCVERAREVLTSVGLADRLHHRPAQLSGGERQRVALARAFAVEPRLLFADEPTSALDSASAGVVLGLLQSFVTPRSSVVMVTHDPRILPLATRVITLADGSLTDDRPGPAAPPPASVPLRSSR